jgi:hypothetical protein
MTKLFDTPMVFELPLSKGGDLFVTFVYKRESNRKNLQPGNFVAR